MKKEKGRRRRSSRLHLVLPDKDEIFIEISKEERENIRKKIKELGGNIETRRGVVRFKKGGAMSKMYLAGLINQRLESPERNL